MIRKGTYKIVLAVSLLLMFSITSQAQYASEEELKTAANEMFDNDDYVGSIKLFSQKYVTSMNF